MMFLATVLMHCHFAIVDDLNSSTVLSSYPMPSSHSLLILSSICWFTETDDLARPFTGGFHPSDLSMQRISGLCRRVAA